MTEIRKEKKQKTGFTLLEIIVAIGVFSVVMLIATGALLSMISANRKAQTLKSVVNNVNFAMENMVKEVRVGSAYHADITVGAIDSPRSAEETSSFAFERSGGDADSATDQSAFRLNEGAIERSDDGGNSWFSITSPEVTIDRLSFSVYGAGTGDSMQPRVIVVMEGSALASGETQEFNVQTTVTQRLLD